MFNVFIMHLFSVLYGLFHKLSFVNSFIMLNKKNKGFRRSKSCPPSTSQSKRSTKRLQWTESQMSAALDAVLNKHLSGNKAAALHGVPPSMSKDRLSGRVKVGAKPGPKGIGKTRRGAGVGDSLVKLGTGNQKIMCYDRYYHFHHHVYKKSHITAGAC